MVGGHEIGGELDAVRLQPDHGTERFHELGLGKARHADEQAMAARQDRDQRIVDDRLLAEDDAPRFPRARRQGG